jgi:hypothetical protein
MGVLAIGPSPVLRVVRQETGLSNAWSTSRSMDSTSTFMCVLRFVDPRLVTVFSSVR